MTPEAIALALQRTAGNAAARVALARKPAVAGKEQAAPARSAAAAPFRVWLVDDGKSGLSDETRKIAIDHVRQELQKLTAPSKNDMVRGGFDVQYRKDPPEYGTDLQRRGELDVSTWLVFLLPTGSTKQAVDLGYKYLRLDHSQREAFEKNAAAHMAKEGGYNLQTYRERPGNPSESVSFVGTDMPVKMQKDKTFGPASAGRLTAEVILHELGHAMGHVRREHEDKSKVKDHSEGGIMAAQTIIGSSGPYAPASYSKTSAERIRARLEWIAEQRAKTK